jgi:hypothetical protein
VRAGTYLRRKSRNRASDEAGDGIEAANDLLFVAKRALVDGLLQTAVHMRQEPDDRAPERIRDVDLGVRAVSESDAFGENQAGVSLNTARKRSDDMREQETDDGGTHPSNDFRVVVTEIEGEAEDERDVDRLDEFAQQDAATSADEVFETRFPLLLVLRKEVREDRRGPDRFAQHRGNRHVGDFGDFL